MQAYREQSLLNKKGKNARNFAERNVERKEQTEKYYSIISYMLED